jgi:hypothetical protein
MVANPDPAAEVMKAAAEAVAGPSSPDAATVVSKPETFPLRMLALGGPAISAIIVGIILLVGAPRWPWLALPIWPDTVAETRVTGLVTIAVALCLILAVIVFRLASGGLKRIEARAGPGSITVESGDASPRSPAPSAVPVSPIPPASPPMASADPS